MLESVNEVAVLVSAILAIAIGSIWYSPLLFGNHWMRAAGLSEGDLEGSKDKILKSILLALIANIVLLFVVAQFVAFTQAMGGELKVTASLLTVFLAAVMASAIIWEQKPISYLLINAGYAAIVVFGGMAVIWYWPW